MIGNAGMGHLHIANGGVFDQNLSTSSDAFIAFDVGSDGDATVSGTDSQWLMRRLDVGRSSTGTLSVEAGGLVRTTATSLSGDVVLGSLAGGDGKVAVFGSGGAASLLDVDDNLYVGDVDMGVLNVGLDLDDTADGTGALQVDGFLYIGDEVGNTAENKVVVAGTNATANVGGVVRAGNGGRGTLEIKNGANFTAAFVRVGEAATGDGTLLVDGPGSQLIATAGSANSIIGTNGLGGATVSDGALFQNDMLWVGYQGSADGTLLIDNATVNAGTGNTTNNDLIIGGRTDGAGGTGAVTVQNGGLLTSAVQTVVGGNATGVGSLTVTGIGSLLDNFDNGPGGASNGILRIGQNGAGTADVLDGGRIRPRAF